MEEHFRHSISVVIPTYNRSHTIVDALESVFKQTYPIYEVIVVDDGSTDNTKEVITQYGDSITYFYQENSGPSVARNTGIKHATGELIAFLDSDDVWREDKIARQAKCFSDAQQVGIVASGHEIRNEKWDLVHVTLLTKKEIAQINKRDLYKNFFSTPSVMVRSRCFEEVGYFDETIGYAEDWDMWLRILKFYECIIINEPLVSVRVNGPSITADCSEVNIDYWQRVLEKHNFETKSVASFTHRKRWSWYYLNKAIVYKDKNRDIAKTSLIKSIIAWPLWFPGRYYNLFKL
jgi:hypothetical protein